MLTITVFEILLFGRLVLLSEQRRTGSERVKFSVKNQKKYSAFVGITWKMIDSQTWEALNVFYFILFMFFWSRLTLLVLEKIENSIFKIWNLQLFFKNVLVEATFTLIVSELLLLESISVLWPAQWLQGEKRFSKEL